MVPEVESRSFSMVSEGAGRGVVRVKSFCSLVFFFFF